MNNMIDSELIASVLGPILIVLSISEYRNFAIWQSPKPSITYLNGLILLSAGILLLRIHFIWKGWPVLISILAIFLIIGGAYRMLFPKAPQATMGIGVRITLAILLASGLFLSYKGYF